MITQEIFPGGDHMFDELVKSGDVASRFAVRVVRNMQKRFSIMRKSQIHVYSLRLPASSFFLLQISSAAIA
jgi:hypothetical protein